MSAQFHLSLPVADLAAGAELLTLLGGQVTHRAAEYVNVDLAGAQLTLKKGGDPLPGEFHFGVNVAVEELEAMAARLETSPLVEIVSPIRTVDSGTPLERKKMYVRALGGYLIELKGYPR